MKQDNIRVLVTEIRGEIKTITAIVTDIKENLSKHVDSDAKSFEKIDEKIKKVEVDTNNKFEKVYKYAGLIGAIAVVIGWFAKGVAG